MARKIIVLDYGQCSWVGYDGTEAFTLTTDEFVTMAFAENCDVYCEHAHIQIPRSDKSLAQPLTAQQRVHLIDNATQVGSRIFRLPEQMTRQVREAYRPGAVKKSAGEDLFDCQAWHSWIQRQPTRYAPLRKRWDSHDRDAIYEFRNRTNQILNELRRMQYESEALRGFLMDANLGLTLKPARQRARIHDALLPHHNHLRAVLCSMNRCQWATLAVMFFDPLDRQYRYRSDTGRVPGIRWLMNNQLGTSAYHFRGGVARSNLYWFGLRFFQNQERDRQKRQLYFRGVRWVLQRFRNATRGYVKDAGCLF